MAGASLTHKWVAHLEQGFSAWLHAHEPGKPNLVKVYRSHHALFERLDAQFPIRAEATAETVLQFIGTATLRKHLLASRFLAEELGIVFSDQLKSDASELDRIEDKLRCCRKQPCADVIMFYHEWLSNAKLQLRTIRLYLSTAVTFCEMAKVKDQAWPHIALEGFLRQRPGLRNNLSKFVKYCQLAYGWKVEMPRRLPKPTFDDQKRKLILELRKLTQQVAHQGIGEVDLKVLEKIIARSLALRIGDVARAPNEHFVEKSGKCAFRVGKEWVSIPGELEPYFSAYATRRKFAVNQK